jgi:hypothetical protein
MITHQKHQGRKQSFRHQRRQIARQVIAQTMNWMKKKQTLSGSSKTNTTISSLSNVLIVEKYDTLLINVLM